MGQNYLASFLPARLVGAFQGLIGGVLAGNPVRAIESPVRSRTGEAAHGDLECHARRCGNGSAVGVICVGQDITERKRAADEVERLNRELEQRVQTRTSELRASEARCHHPSTQRRVGIVTTDADGRCARRQPGSAVDARIQPRRAAGERPLHDLTAARPTACAAAMPSRRCASTPAPTC